MENRFLSRGKRIDNGEWVIGNRIDSPDGRVAITETSGEWELYECIPGTICQCTGLKDKNGNLIWENDIVKDKNGNLYKAFWQDNYYQFSWICIKSNSLPVGAKWDFYSIKSFEIEVIGNVFDNPELLEVQP